MRTRVLTALVLIPLALGAVLWTNPWPLRLLLALLVGLSVDEVSRLTLGRGAKFAAAGTICVVFYWVWLHDVWALSHLLAQLAALAIIGVLVAPLLFKRKSVFVLEIASLWIAAPLAAIGLLRDPALFPAPIATFDLHSPLLMLALPLWAGDTLAYLVGKQFGRHRLAPAISPKKTVEGATANLIGCTAVAALLAPWVQVSMGTAVACGLVAGTMGQAGDLFQSWMKRQAGAKDSGTLLPGHGGVLDRIDSLLFAAPIQALILAASLNPRR